MFVIAMNIYLRTRIEHDLDIVLEVKLARQGRPQFIGRLVGSSLYMLVVILQVTDLYIIYIYVWSLLVHHNFYMLLKCSCFGQAFRLYLNASSFSVFL